MTLEILTTLFLFYINSVRMSAQVPSIINKAAADIFLSFSQNKSLPITELDKLHSLLNSEVNDKEFVVDKEAYDSLRNHFEIFQSECKNISYDSSLFLFNQWYLELSNVFYDYHKEKFFSSNKTKILLFSTSMSCYCTLEMCKNQTIDILKLIKENNDVYDYWIVDSYKHDELQIKYETYFTPSVLIINGKNELQSKVEYDEKMIEKLKDSLNK